MADRDDIHQIKHILEEMLNKASRFLDRFWPMLLKKAVPDAGVFLFAF